MLEGRQAIVDGVDEIQQIITCLMRIFCSGITEFVAQIQ